MFVMVTFTLVKLYRQTKGFHRSPVLRVLAMDGENTRSFVQHELTWSSCPILCCALPRTLGNK